MSGEASYSRDPSAPPIIPIARPIVGDEEFAAIRDVLASCMLAQGVKVKAFEQAFAADIGRKHGIAVANGKAVLHITSAAQESSWATST